MSKVKVLVSQTDNVMHLARLVKQASVDSVSQPICLFGAYMAPALQQWHYPLSPTCPTTMLRFCFYTYPSVHLGGGVGLPQCMLGSPPGTKPPWEQAPTGTRPPSPRSRHQTPWSRHQHLETKPPWTRPPWSRHPLPVPDTPPQMTTVADGTHHTGMHSCLVLFSVQCFTSFRPLLQLQVTSLFLL